ncbi:ABC transporter ATP-binding protein [Ovoidimarina sediminis]|uniref:ABC transporter ATP-binding protein n=1 Tax=Ovoidimarina sediminis TaxID=3079856 RepID=UPI002909176E|nr:ABC transporter ATP-binding protein [Rhodophyticola sp. MJ-SS7]MDU8943273.1 ABC transporter ATP-binding protein [Rhodophyticola sp. MJ-SS7]
MIRTYRMILETMEGAERRRFWLVVAVTFVISAFEAASVVAILPFLQILSDPGIIETTPTLARLYDLSGLQSTNAFLIAIGCAVLLLTTAGLASKILTIWITTRFALMRSYTLSARLLSVYLSQPYRWYLTKNSADIGTDVLAEVDILARDALLPAMRLIPELFSVALIGIALCLIEPAVAIGSVALIGGGFLLVYLVVQRLLLRVGARRLGANNQRFRLVQEATGGIKDVKILGLEQTYLNRFKDPARRMAEAQTTGQIVMHTPRFALEALAFCGMIVLILFMLIRSEGDLAQVVPTLGLLAAAGLRLFPALQQVYFRSSLLRQTRAALEKIHTDLVSLEHHDIDETRGRLDLTRALEMKQIAFNYEGGERPVLHGIDLCLPARTSLGLVGGTGAGKTTLVDIILGLLPVGGGAFTVDGTAIEGENLRRWQKSIGYVPQQIYLSDATLAENIAFGVPEDEIDLEAVMAAARIANLHDFVLETLPDGYRTRVGERGVRLSGGQRQRIGIARALYRKPTTLVLDEATSALDNLTELAVMEAIRRLAGEVTLIIIAHRLSTVKDCDQILLLRDGLVAAQGTFAEIIAADEEFARMAGAG